jgi:hypothetical protein
MRRRTTTPETHTLIHNRFCFRPVSTPAQNSIGAVAQNSVGADKQLVRLVPAVLSRVPSRGDV